MDNKKGTRFSKAKNARASYLKKSAKQKRGAEDNNLEIQVARVSSEVENKPPEDATVNVFQTKSDAPIDVLDIKTGAERRKSKRRKTATFDPKLEDKVGDQPTNGSIFPETATKFDASKIHLLVYNPRIKIDKRQADRISLYVADYVFIMSNLVTLLLIVYYIVVGVTIVSFCGSLQSITPQEEHSGPATPAPAPGHKKPKVRDVTLLQSQITGMPMTTVGLALIGGGIFQVFNSVIGIFGVVQGHKSILVQHMVCDIAFVIFEYVLSIMIIYLGKCNKDDLEKTQNSFMHYIHRYALPTPGNEDEAFRDRIATHQLDTIQIALACCGAQSWADYLNPEILKDDKDNVMPHKTTLDGTELVFPASCCRPWWVRNIHCAAGVHLWANPAIDEKNARKFRLRINQIGCIPRLKAACERTLFLAGKGLLIVAIIDVVVVIAETVSGIIITKSIIILIRQKKLAVQLENKKYAGEFDTDEEFESSNEEEEEEDLFDEKALEGKKSRISMKDLMTKRPNIILPTEDQIQLIKSRSDFNKFEARVRGTRIGMWMRGARQSVVANEPLTHSVRIPPFDISNIDITDAAQLYQKSNQQPVYENPVIGNTLEVKPAGKEMETLKTTGMNIKKDQ